MPQSTEEVRVKITKTLELPHSGIKRITSEILFFTEEKLKKLKEVYSEAKNNGSSCTCFEGHEFLTSYAGYIISHISEEFKKEKSKPIEHA